MRDAIVRAAGPGSKRGLAMKRRDLQGGDRVSPSLSRSSSENGEEGEGMVEMLGGSGRSL
ncbi:hypothetical protein CSUI_007421, partial [Cystoisospora suis]